MAGPGANVAADIPIGLRVAGSCACDELARRALAPRRASSVFPAPLRAVLGLASHRDASDIRRRIEGKGMSIQAFNITRKVHEVDDALRQAGDRATRVYEMQPEVSFAKLNGGRPMTFAKTDPSGPRRTTHASRGGLRRRARSVVAERPRRQVAADDVLDALAALCTAMRIGCGTHDSLPAERERDAHGLRMATFA